MIHTGIDLVRISRIEEAIKNDKNGFLGHICTANEITRLQGEKRLPEKIAGLFSLKEAFSKALGTGFGEHLSFLDLEVDYTSRGQPQMRYSGEKFKKSSLKWQLSCSLSHEGDYVVGIVIINGEIQ